MPSTVFESACLERGKGRGSKSNLGSNLPDFATLHNFSGGGDLTSLQFVPFAWNCCRAAGYHNNGVCVRGMRRRYNDGNEDDKHKGEEDVSKVEKGG